MKSPFCYLTQNLAKSFCQPLDMAVFSFVQFAVFRGFCAPLCDNLCDSRDISALRALDCHALISVFSATFRYS